MRTESGFFKLWKWVALGAPLWWALGLSLFVYHLTALVLFIFVSIAENRNERGLYLPPAAFFLIVLSGVYLFTLLIHLFDADISRILASAYNWAFWMMGFFLIVVLANLFEVIDIRPVLNVCYILAWITGGLSLLMFCLTLYGVSSLIIPTPLLEIGTSLSQTALVQYSLSMMFLVFDWFASASRPRLNILAPYPTATAGLMILLMMMVFVRALIDKKLKSPVFWFLILINLIGIMMTLARMTVFAFSISFLAVWLIGKRYWVIWLLFIITALALAEPWIAKSMSYLWGLREGSGIARFELYQYSLKQLEGADWFLGLGLKPREDTFDFPIGSHSTYLSLIFKTGVTGFLIFTVFQINLFIRWYRVKADVVDNHEWFHFWRGLGWVFVAMGIWMLTEDIDAPQLLAFFYFSFIGIFEGFSRRISGHGERVSHRAA